MPYGQDPKVQQALEDISRGKYRSRGNRGKPVSGTSIVNRYMRDQDEDIKSRQRFTQGIGQARALEGMASPTPTRSKINLDIGRSLEGMRQEGSVGFGPDAAGKRNLSDVMERFGDPQFGAVFRQPELRLQGEGGKEMVELAKEEPRLFAELMALSTIQAASKVAASTSRDLGGRARGDEPLNLLSAINELTGKATGQQAIRQGTVEFMRPEFRKEPTAGERIEVGLAFIPGLGPLGGITRGVAKAAKTTQRLGAVATPVRMAKNAKDEINRVAQTTLGQFDQLDDEIRFAQQRGDKLEAARLQQEKDELRLAAANDVALHRSGIRPVGLTRDQELSLGFIDERGYPNYSVMEMTRQEVGEAVKRTLKDGKKRQEELFKKGRISRVDPLPDWDDPEYIKFLDEYYDLAVREGNAIRTRGADDNLINWAGLANDHIEAVANGGPNTYNNLVAIFGRLNSQKGTRY